MKAIVEIPKGCTYKYEINEHGKLTLDRVINQEIPFNYGFIPDTICEDGDPLDVFIISEHPIVPLTEVPVEPIGILKCKDNGVRDDKLIAKIKGADETQFFHKLTKIIDYLSTYKSGFEMFDYVETCNLEDYTQVLTKK